MSDIAPASNDHEYARASAKYSASFMSNAKWLKLFQAIISSGVKIERAEWRYIDSAAVDHNALPEDCDLLPTRFADGRFQPFEYK
ncbi:MAG TPA: hypothetical protein VFI26_05455, partial [Lysobacter sp.]|nr:hypothetical protein [Lysobacter sp.]